MQWVAGIAFHLIGGVASGSFYAPYKQVKGWHWETLWLAGGLVSWLLAPAIVAAITLPGFLSLLELADGQVLASTFAMGVLWGFGGLLYGLGVRYLGLSLGNSVILGFCAAFGALVPPLLGGVFSFLPAGGFHDLGAFTLAGVVLCLGGIALCGKAGMLREALKAPLQANDPQRGRRILRRGLLVACFSGILSSFFNFGIETGKPIAALAVAAGHDPLFQNNASFVLILWGGTLTNVLWCALLHLRNQSWTDYLDASKPLLRNYALCSAAGILWYTQFFFYGMGESKLGNGPGSWILHMSFIILTANILGIAMGEWKNTNLKTKRTLAAGIASIMLAVAFIALE